MFVSFPFSTFDSYSNVFRIYFTENVALYCVSILFSHVFQFSEEIGMKSQKKVSGNIKQCKLQFSLLVCVFNVINNDNNFLSMEWKTFFAFNNGGQTKCAIHCKL